MIIDFHRSSKTYAMAFSSRCTVMLLDGSWAIYKPKTLVYDNQGIRISILQIVF